MPVRIGGGGGRRFVQAAASGGGGGGRGSTTAPTGLFTVGTQVGVPTGTSLTTTTNLPTADATESLSLTHPVTGSTASRNVQVWRNRRWTTKLQFVPPGGATTYLFDQCSFSNSDDNWVVQVTDDNFTTNTMAPLVVFRRCTFEANSSCAGALVGGNMWIIDCHINGGEDGYDGGYYTVVKGSNLIATTNTTASDPHMDGIQNVGTGDMTVYNCWLTPGFLTGANACVRIGTEFGGVSGVNVHYCGLDGGGYALQFRGDAGAADIDTVSIVGNRWTHNAGFGPFDFQQVTGVTWTDNAYFDGTPITYP